MSHVRHIAIFCGVLAGLVGAAGPVAAAPNAASPDSYGDRNIGHFGDPNQGFFGNPDTGNFLDAYFDPIRGKFDPRPGEPATNRTRPYVVLKQPLSDPAPAAPAQKP